MSIFDKNKFSREQPAVPKSYEYESHLILRKQLEIDLSQPDRAPDFTIEMITGYAQSKLIAEIKTPKDHIGIIHTQLETSDHPSIMIVGNKEGVEQFIKPNEVLDLSDIGEKGKCIISMDVSGKHLFVQADDPDTKYQIFTRQLEQFIAVEDFSSDDPDY
jgi:hypothetical protein